MRPIHGVFRSLGSSKGWSKTAGCGCILGLGLIVTVGGGVMAWLGGGVVGGGSGYSVSILDLGLILTVGGRGVRWWGDAACLGRWLS